MIRKPLWSAALCVALATTCVDPVVVDPIGQVAVTPRELSLLAGDSARLAAEVLGTSGDTLRVRLRWQSSDSAVAFVRSDGMVIAGRGGVALVAASAGGHNGIAQILVRHPPLRGPREYAHRAYAALFPENTLVAIDSAFARGAAGVEVDVQLSADRVPVIIHDGTVDRTTNGSGRVIEMTGAALRDLDACSWKGTSWAPCRVPLLGEVLDAVRGRGYLLLDLKGPWPTEDLGRLLSQVHGRGMRDSVTIISFSLDHLWRVRVLDNRISLGLLASALPDPSIAPRLGHTAVLVDKDALRDSGAIVLPYALQLREHGSLLGAFTIYSANSAPTLRDLGASWFITDVPLDRTQLGAPVP